MTLDAGESGINLRGSFDRVEVDRAGAVHICDLKTQKSKVRGDDLPMHPQLGVYQLAVRDGALDSLSTEVRALGGLPVDGDRPEVAGAELVQLRLGRDDTPDIQAQGPIGGGATWVDDALAAADRHVRAEAFPARPGDSCRFCAFRRACPALDEGREVLP